MTAWYNVWGRGEVEARLHWLVPVGAGPGGTTLDGSVQHLQRAVGYVLSLQSLLVDLHSAAPHATACCRKSRDLHVNLTLFTSRTAAGHLHAPARQHAHTRHCSTGISVKAASPC